MTRRSTPSSADRRGDDPPCSRARPARPPPAPARAPAARRRPERPAQPGDDHLAGLVHRQAEPFEFFSSARGAVLGLALFGVDLPLAVLEGTLSADRDPSLVEDLLLLLYPLLLVRNPGSSAAMLPLRPWSAGGPPRPGAWRMTSLAPVSASERSCAEALAALIGSTNHALAHDGANPASDRCRDRARRSP